MLYRLTLSCKPTTPITASDYYYSILGAVMSIFENQQEIYDALIKISYQTKQSILEIHLTIQGQEKYNKVMSVLLSQSSLTISIDNQHFSLDQIKLDSRIFDPNALLYKPFHSFQFFFHSPTFIRQNNIISLLPEPTKFLMSSFDKLQKLGYFLDIDKKQLRYALDELIVGEYKLRTEQVTIKKNKKAGCVGMMKIHTKALDDERKKTLFFVLQALPFVGMGSGVKLGLGNVGWKSV